MSLTWTTERPTVPGWYWCQFLDERPFIVDIHRWGTGMRVWFSGDERPEKLSDFKASRWAGPLTPPEAV